MQVKNLKLSGLKLIVPQIFPDSRGFFLETHNFERYCEVGVNEAFVQDNLSFSKQNVIRALHFDLGQAKLITCLKGKIYDVVVDIRPDSPTFGQWEAVELGECGAQLFVPKGFAHGFCILSKEALVQYKVSSSYNPKTEKSIRWNDPNLAIDWPVKEPILSIRDQSSPFFKEVFNVVDHRR